MWKAIRNVAFGIFGLALAFVIISVLATFGAMFLLAVTGIGALALLIAMFRAGLSSLSESGDEDEVVIQRYRHDD